MHNICIQTAIQSWRRWSWLNYYLVFLTFFIPSLWTAGCWQPSRAAHGEASGCGEAKGQPLRWGQLFSQKKKKKNQHLFYLTMIWFGLHGNCRGNLFAASNLLEEVQQRVWGAEMSKERLQHLACGRFLRRSGDGGVKKRTESRVKFEKHFSDHILTTAPRLLTHPQAWSEHLLYPRT